jgi:hypothetical protein
MKATLYTNAVGDDGSAFGLGRFSHRPFEPRGVNRWTS